MPLRLGLFRAIIEALPQLVWSCRGDGPCDYLGPQWVAYTGIPEDEQLGYVWLERIHPDDREATSAGWAAAVEQKGPADFDFRIRRHDGAYRWFKTRAVPHVEADGTIVRWYGTNTDVQDLYDSEAALAGLNAELKVRVQDSIASAYELERSNKDLQQFAYAASHDLQEPLRAVSGCAQILQQRFRGRLDPQADELIGHMVDGAGRMRRLIDDLLAYSQVGTHGDAWLDVSLTQAVDGARRNLQQAATEAHASITIGELPTIRADCRQMVQLFQNLLSNAIKYAGADPPQIDVRSCEGNGVWIISIRDHGIGVPELARERIFEIFQRLHSRDEYPGTGVGLALCRRIVERHGGRIWVEPVTGAGTEFRFALPMAR